MKHRNISTTNDYEFNLSFSNCLTSSRLPNILYSLYVVKHVIQIMVFVSKIVKFSDLSLGQLFYKLKCQIPYKILLLFAISREMGSFGRIDVMVGEILGGIPVRRFGGILGEILGGVLGGLSGVSKHRSFSGPGRREQV